MNNKKLLTFLLVVLTIQGGSLFGQPEKHIRTQKPIFHYTLNAWGTEQGIPSNNVNDVFQASDGFLWISTFNGLVKFDGVRFDVYNTDNLEGLSANGIYKGVEDEDGNLWFATQTSGLIQYRSGEFKIHSREQGLPNSVRDVLVDSKGIVWVGSNNEGLFRSKEGGFEKVDFIDELNNSTINVLAESPTGEIYIGTANSGLYILNDSGYEKMNESTGLKSNVVKTINFHGGRTYLGTINGFCAIEDGVSVHFEELNGIEINEVTIGPEGFMWLGTEMGLVRHNLENEWEFYTEEEGLPSRQISSLGFDVEGNLWIGSKKSGLLRLKYSNFTSITEDEGLSNNMVNAIFETRDGRFLVGSDNGDIDIISNEGIEPLFLAHNLKNISIKDILQARDGSYWFATYRGVIHVGNNYEGLYTNNQSFPDNQARVLFEDSEGNMWIGYKNGGLVRLKPNGDLEVYNRENGLGSDYILSINEYKGQIIVGTHSGGLNFISKSGEIETKYPLDLDAGLLIFNLIPTNNDELWLATNVGLIIYRNDEFISIDSKKGLGAEAVFDMKDDLHGGLWLSSSEGVVRIQKQQVLDFLDGKIDKIEHTLYDNNDGMITKECTAATKSIMTSSGEIWFPTLGGIVIVEPQNLSINVVHPPVYINGLNLDDEKWITAESQSSTSGYLPIKPGYKRYTFDFTALSLTAPSKVRFKYKLDGFDEDWTEVINQREAKYTNLKPGKYTFKVQGSNNDSIWNPQEARLSFEVKPMFYQTVWFYIVITLVLGGLLYWRIRNIQRHNSELRKLNDELDSFVYSTSHDLRAPLMSVLGLVNIAKLDPDPAMLKVYLNSIESSVTKLDKFISDIIDYSRNSRLELTPIKVLLKQSLSSVFTSLAYLDPENKIEKRVVVADDAGSVITDERRLNIVLSNILSNSFRYHRDDIDNPFIEVEVNTGQKGVLISVRDNGQGIKDEHHQKIFEMFYRGNESSNGSGLGLYIVKETIDKLGGEITFTSKWNVGTTFSIQIPSLNGKWNKAEKRKPGISTGLLST